MSHDGHFCLFLVAVMSIQNLQSHDPFALDAGEDETAVQQGFIHIRIQQRSGRKTCKAFKKEFACNGTVASHPEHGEVIQLQGDQRKVVCDFLAQVGIAKRDQIKVHGF